jgi:hypothetical protein
VTLATFAARMPRTTVMKTLLLTAPPSRPG